MPRTPGYSRQSFRLPVRPGTSPRESSRRMRTRRFRSKRLGSHGPTAAKQMTSYCDHTMHGPLARCPIQRFAHTIVRPATSNNTASTVAATAEPDPSGTAAATIARRSTKTASARLRPLPCFRPDARLRGFRVENSVVITTTSTRFSVQRAFHDVFG